MEKKTEKEKTEREGQKWFTTTNILDGICGILFANINKLFWGRILSTENKPLQSYQLLAFKQAPAYSSVQEQKIYTYPGKSKLSTTACLIDNFSRPEKETKSQNLW